MALITYLIIPLIVLILLFIVFKFIFKIFKYFMIAFVLLIIVTGVSGYLVYKDAKSLAENFGTENKLFLIDIDKIEAGFVIAQDEPIFLTQGQVDFYNDLYLNKDYGNMLGDNYKVLILKIDKIEYSSQILDYEGLRLDKVLIFEIIKSDNPKDLLYNLMFSDKPRQSFDSAFSVDNVEFKSALALLLFMQEFKKNNVLFIVKEFKKGNIIVYPETAVFKFIKILPNDFINDVVTKLSI